MCAHQRKWFARSDTVINTITVAVTVAMADTATVVVTIAIEPATTCGGLLPTLRSLRHIDMISIGTYSLALGLNCNVLPSWILLVSSLRISTRLQRRKTNEHAGEMRAVETNEHAGEMNE